MDKITEKLPEISVIVPVYNMEKYLCQCLDAIKRQSFVDWECILVDDGSLDRSPEICESYAKADSRFKVIHKPNGGLSSARNAGLRIAKGKYLAFVDSDDWPESKYLEVLYNSITRNNADLAQCGFVKEFTSFSRKKSLSKDEAVISRDEFGEELLRNKTVPSFMWNKLFRREVVVEEFPEGKVYEDFYAMTSWAPYIRKVVVTPQVLYHYRMRRGSISLKNDVAFQLDFLEAIKQRAAALAADRDRNIEEKKITVFLYKNLIERAKLIARMEKDTEKGLESIELIRAELLKLPLPDPKETGKKVRKRADMLVKNPKLFIKMMKIGYMLDLHSRYCRSKTYE